MKVFGITVSLFPGGTLKNALLEILYNLTYLMTTLKLLKCLQLRVQYASSLRARVRYGMRDVKIAIGECALRLLPLGLNNCGK